MTSLDTDLDHLSKFN